jgi:AbrB family looped-hinge helix DNA binding protein
VQTSKLTVKGQITIPSDIREMLGIKAGSDIGFDIMPDGNITLVKVDAKKSMAGVLKDVIKNTSPVSIDDMNTAIHSGWQSHERD